MEKSSIEDISKVLDFNFKNSLILKSLDVHCPNCDRHYVVNPHEIMVPKPSFVCKSCSTSFFINYPECAFEKKIFGVAAERKALSKVDFQLNSHFVETPPEEAQIPLPLDEVASLPQESPSIKQEAKNSLSLKESQKNQDALLPTENHLVTPVKACPKCEFVNPASIEECLKCSVVFSKVHSQTQFGQKVFASDELKDLWELAIDNYEVESAHDNFIRYSHVEGNLEYASQKYNSILSVNPYDDMANAMKKRIISLSAIDMEKSAIEPVKSVFRFFNLTTLTVALGLSLILLGYVFPEFKNLMGIGASSLCLIAGLRYLQIRN